MVHTTEENTVTIVLPVYNGEAFLRQAIDSILAQTFTDYELWVVNDGSTDGSMAIVEGYADSRIVRKDNPSNLGLVATLNNTFAQITTPFIARMDADDIWHPRKLELQMAHLRQHPSVGICGTSIHKFGDIDQTMIFPKESNALKVGLLFYCMMSHPSVVFRRESILKHNLTYNPDFFPAEDYKLWIDALKVTDIHNLQTPLVEYRQHENQICRKKHHKQLDLESKLREEQLRLIYPNPTAEEIAYHLTHFVALNPQSDAEVLQMLRWKSRLCQVNRQNRFIEPTIFDRELTRYVGNAIRNYYASSWQGIRHHIATKRYKSLDTKHNLSLILHRHGR
ncbi:MAG: glycosyltransferase family 2 protein [Bacteroidales bacterium]|nr:glycosyltransferase family 2 protein [Bacteroidales bacterium]MBR1799439.1 glycosyltransferase family 2 protein [Bacteroidales bacterium]